MDKSDLAVAVYNTHTEAKEAVKRLETAGFDMKKLSSVEGLPQRRARSRLLQCRWMKAWGKMGAFWGGLWGMLFGAAFFVIPGIGPVVVAGPLVCWLVGALEGAVVVGGLSALSAGLFSIGIPKDSVMRYEIALKADKFLLLAHGTADEVATASDIIKTTGAIESAVHPA